MSVRGIDHVQVAAPPGCESEARRFYGELLELDELKKPPLLAARGGAWFRAGAHELHVGVEQDFAPARKAHPAFEVDDLEALAGRLGEVAWADPLEIPGTRRFHVYDPFGNRLEFVESRWGAAPRT